MTKTVWTLAKGIAMGAADVVPGVSGGTIALLTGIYPRLINAITAFNIRSIQLIFKGKFKEFWQSIDGNFLLPLLIGIAFAFLLLAHPIKYAINHHPIPTWSFFFGLIIASSILIIKQIPNKKPINYLWLIPGIAFGYLIGSQTEIPFPNNNFAILFAGMFAICAMILPGISGSFILVLLGMYQLLILAVADRDFNTLLIFILGAIVGLLIFSRIIKWTLSQFYQQSLFFLSGLMLGSLVKVWPWKAESFDSKMLINILPNDSHSIQIPLALTMMTFAVVLVFSTEIISKKFNK